MSKTALLAYTKTDKPGAVAVAAGAAVWGLFWLPLRYLHDAGIGALWAITLIMAAAILPSLAAMHWRGESHDFRSRDCWRVGLALGLSSVLYFTAVIYSDVIRVIFLFYLLPLWTTVSARLIYGEPIRGTHLLVIVAALIGVWLLLGAGTAWPWPRNIGDWCGIAAGLCWGVSLALLRAREQTPAFATTACAITVALVISCSIATIATLSGDAVTHGLLQAVDHALSVTLTLGAVFGALVLFPAMLGQIWGARRIPAPTASLLTMTEIIVATVSAGLLIGTDLQPLSWLGGLIIVMAVCIDLSVQRNR